MNGINTADPHNEDGAFDARVGAGLLGAGTVGRVGRGVSGGRGEDVGAGVLDGANVEVGRRVIVGAGVFVDVGGYAKLINSGSVGLPKEYADGL